MEMQSSLYVENYCIWAYNFYMEIKKLFEKQKQAARIIFDQDKFTHVLSLLKTLNALNVYQINLLQVLLSMHKIKRNSSPRIFLHRFQIINHKYATHYSRINFKEPKREANYAKCCIHAQWSGFFSIWVFFHNQSRITGLQGKGRGAFI